LIKRRLFTSLSFTLATSLVRLYPPIEHFLGRLATAVAQVIPLPIWLIHIVFLLFATGCVFVILYVSPIGPTLDDWFDLLLRRLRLQVGPRPGYYSADERTSDQYKADISHAMKTTRRMYCLLISAYTLIYEEERFIFDHLQDLSQAKLKKKDIRILLLDVNSDEWSQRAELLINRRLSGESIDLETYRSRCRDVEQQLRNDCRAKIAFYRDNPRWRIYIFDKRAFVSRYFGPPEATDLVEGHLNAVAAFDESHPMFDWLYWEFKKNCPEQWKRELPYRI
jgi:hypothetical protein